MIEQTGEVYVHVERTRKNDPVIIASVFAVATIIFFLLAIIVPSALKNSADPKFCAATDWLRRDEQTICRPSSRNDYIAKIFSGQPSYLRYYRLLRSDLQDSIDRRHIWKGTVQLSQGPFIFPITSSNYAGFEIKANCSKGKCEDVKLYWIYRDNFHEANKSGVFDEDMYGSRYQDFSTPIIYSGNIDGAECYYLVLANHNNEAQIDYEINVHYNAYDMAKAKVTNCTSSECVFEDVDTSEVIVMEYIDPNNVGPVEFSMEFKSKQGSYAGVVIFAILFCIITVGCAVVTVLFILQKLGKINLLKKAGVKVQTEDSGSYEAPLVPGQGGVSISKVTVSNDELL